MTKDKEMSGVRFWIFDTMPLKNRSVCILKKISRPNKLKPKKSPEQILQETQANNSNSKTKCLTDFALKLVQIYVFFT